MTEKTQSARGYECVRQCFQTSPVSVCPHRHFQVQALKLWTAGVSVAELMRFQAKMSFESFRPISLRCGARRWRRCVIHLNSNQTAALPEQAG